METIKTIRGFHWITKIVIALTLLLLGLLLAAGMIGSYWMSNQADVNAFQAYQGLSKMAMSLAWVLTQAFLVILVIIAVYMAVTRVQAWIERYLDAMVVKMDNLSEQKSERESAGAALAAMNEKFAQIEKKLDNIESILEKVAD